MGVVSISISMYVNYSSFFGSLFLLTSCISLSFHRSSQTMRDVMSGRSVRVKIASVNSCCIGPIYCVSMCG